MTALVPHLPRILTPRTHEGSTLASPLGAAAAFLFGIAGFAWLGTRGSQPLPPTSTAIVLLDKLLSCGWPAAAYFLSAWGLGRAVKASFDFVTNRRSRAQRTPRIEHPLNLAGSVGLCMGLGVLLSASHAWAWLFPISAFGAWALLTPGLAAVLWRCAAFARRTDRGTIATALSRSTLRKKPTIGDLAFVPFGVMFAAACVPPGNLWASEFGGYDVLSYHLALPNEWMRLGKLVPLPHNVYSFLPGYLEAAFLHLGVLLGGNAALGEPASSGMFARGMSAGDGEALLASQMLHAGIAVFACRAVSCLVRAVLDACGVGAHAAAGVARWSLCFAAFTPWVLVTGSLAYNDMGAVLFLTAAALVLVRASPDGNALRHGAIVGLLVGFACCIKPTALLMGALPLGIAILARYRAAGVRTLLGASLAGTLSLAPWLVRNALHSGNPVFPFAAKLFPNTQGGTGHWSAEQVARFVRGHTFAGSLPDRLRLVLFADHHDPTLSVLPTFRGVTHPQWGAVFACGLLAGVCGLWIFFRRKAVPGTAGSLARAGGLVLVCVLVQCAVWLFATHVQSRFLLPVLPSTCAMIALYSTAMLHAATGHARIIRASLPLLAGLCLCAQGFSCIRTILGQEHGAARALLAWPSLYVGSQRDTGTLTQRAPSAELQANLTLGAAPHILLIGQATPLYFRTHVAYATAWDTPTCLQVDGQPWDASWTDALHDAGSTHAVIDFVELERLERSGYLDPRLSPATIGAWARAHTTVLAEWRERGQVLVQLRAPVRFSAPMTRP